MSQRVNTLLGRSAVALVSLGLAAAPGCAKSSGPKQPPHAAKRPGEGAPVFESPARWVAFPQTIGSAQSALALDDGRCLVLTDDGQRWVITPRDKAQACIGVGVASGSPTLEPLVGAQKVGAEYRFIAEGGAVYTSREPNGPFSRYAKAPKYLRHVTARGSAIVGLDDGGSTFFYDGTAWKTATVPKGAAGIDVAADDKGRVLWVGAPETLLVSTDGGHTFGPPPGAAPPRLGTYEAAFTASGKLGTRGALGNLAWDTDGIAKTSETMSDVHVPDVEIEPALGPRASAIAAERAVMDGARYYEVIDSYDGSRYGLAKASLGGSFDRIALEELASCENVKIAARGSLLAFGCTKQVDARPNLVAELWQSKDGGATLELVQTLATPTFTDLSLAVAQDGSMLVAGACKPPGAKADDKASAKEASGKKRDEDGTAACNPKGPLLVRGTTVTSGTVPSLEEGTARSPTLTADGRTAYFLGRNRKDSMPAVYVSRDGGRTYQMRTIEAPQAANWEDDDSSGGDPEGGGYTRPLYLSEGVTLTMDETGTLGVVGERDVGSAWVTLDADGRIANVGEPPEPSFLMGGIGNRVIALGYGQNDGVLRSWESLDGGATWTEVATTPAVQRYGERGGTFSCAAGGCVLGDELVRVGWEGQSESPFTITDETFPTPPDPTLGTAISCQLVAKSEWVAIEGRPEERFTSSSYAAYSSGPGLPRLREIARGKTLFSVASVAEDGKIEIASAAFPDKEASSSSGGAALTRKVLFGPVKPPKTGYVATTFRAQVEGYVALRATVPFAKGGGLDTSKKMEGFELGWQNQFTGAFGKKTVSFDTTWTPAVTSGANLRPTLLTVVLQGAIAQPTGVSKAVYADSSSTQSFEYPSLTAIVHDKRPVTTPDAAYLGGRPFALGIADRSPSGQVIIDAPATSAGGKAKSGGKESSPAPQGSGAHAFTLGTALSEVDWMYSTDKVGFMTLLSSSAEGGPPSAVGFFVENDGSFGAPFELPTLADLADRPQPCSMEDRKTTARTISPHFGHASSLLFGNSRHAVMVTDAVASSGPSASLGAAAMEPLWLLTDGAVLHGTKKSPCLSAWHAAGVRPGLIAVISGNLEQSWLLRTTSGTKPNPGKQPSPSKRGAPVAMPGFGRWAQIVEARPMVCRYQADLSVPYEVASRAGQRMTDDLP